MRKDTSGKVWHVVGGRGCPITNIVVDEDLTRPFRLIETARVRGTTTQSRIMLIMRRRAELFALAIAVGEQR